MRKRERMIQIKSAAEIELMREAGLVVGRTLEALKAAAVPGVTTRDLDALAESACRVRPTTSPASRISAISWSDLIWIMRSRFRNTWTYRAQSSNRRSALMARSVTSSTGPVASTPLSRPRSP